MFCCCVCVWGGLHYMPPPPWQIWVPASRSGLWCPGSPVGPAPGSRWDPCPRLTAPPPLSPAQVEQMFAVTPIDVAGNIDYKSLCYIITHGDEKED
ncbi:peptide chain release factor 2 [Platysternon megacephalum]|uniref:Peptide chain release factor 2 n=1 Tax=Platysternon megacephalum TaxID=55544 RepID=A0A4D9DJ25_9SAUR|nr:peptide chain release factor 2 [Platysternon megacephalum]